MANNFVEQTSKFKFLCFASFLSCHRFSSLSFLFLSILLIHYQHFQSLQYSNTTLSRHSNFIFSPRLLYFFFSSCHRFSSLSLILLLLIHSSYYLSAVSFIQVFHAWLMILHSRRQNSNFSVLLPFFLPPVLFPLIDYSYRFFLFTISSFNHCSSNKF